MSQWWLLFPINIDTWHKISSFVLMVVAVVYTVVWNVSSLDSVKISVRHTQCYKHVHYSSSVFWKSYSTISEIVLDCRIQSQPITIQLMHRISQHAEKRLHCTTVGQLGIWEYVRRILQHEWRFALKMYATFLNLSLHEIDKFPEVYFLPGLIWKILKKCTACTLTSNVPPFYVRAASSLSYPKQSRN